MRVVAVWVHSQHSFLFVRNDGYHIVNARPCVRLVSSESSSSYPLVRDWIVWVSPALYLLARCSKRGGQGFISLYRVFMLYRMACILQSILQSNQGRCWLGILCQMLVVGKGSHLVGCSQFAVGMEGGCWESKLQRLGRILNSNPETASSWVVIVVYTMNGAIPM